MMIFRRPLLLTFVAALLAAATYVDGFLVGRFLELRPVNEFCSAKPLADPSLDYGLLPLKNRCLWADGTSTDLVPAYINPLVVTFSALAVAGWFMSVRGLFRSYPHDPSPTTESTT